MRALDSIQLEHGSGGALSRELVNELIYPFFKSPHYDELSDASPLKVARDILVTTDTYVVDPPFFPGGDIGRLSVFGTCNDLAVSGGRPLYLTLGMILEEGFLLDDLRKVLQSVAEAAQQSGVRIVTGDTKVVPSGKGGGIFINTSGIAERVFPHPLTPQNIRSGDSILVSGPLGAHGITILASRESLRVGKHLLSDCAFLFPLCESLFSLGRDIRFLRDATRGGLAAVLNEAASGTDFGIRIRENSLPIQEDVSYVSEILGLSPVEIANEGVFVAIVSSARRDEALDLLMSHSLGKQAAVIGEVLTSNPGRVVLETAIGGHRILDFPRGLILPRIC